MDSRVIGLMVVGLMVIGIGIGVFFIVRHQRWKKALADRGWRYDPNPSLAHVQTLGNPPFDVGLVRTIDDAIIGTTSAGWAFQCFEYEYTGAGGSFSDRLAMVNLPQPLPELYVHNRSVTPRRVGVRLPEVPIDPSFSATFMVRAADPAFAQTALNPTARQQITEWSAMRPLDLSIDHQSLVALGAPKDPEALTEFLDRLAAVASAVNPGALQQLAIPPKEPRYGFYGQDWTYVGVDNGIIPYFQGVHPFGVGHGHRTSDVLRGTTRNIPMIAFTYHWQTTRTVTSTDSQGRTTTRTVTDNHEQALIALTMPVEMPSLSIAPEGLLGFGRDIDFESDAFNKAFKVNCPSRRFAYDVLHPRMLEFLMAARPSSFMFFRDLLIIYPHVHDTEVITQSTDFLTSFLGRIPTFVWKDLGTTPPPVH